MFDKTIKILAPAKIILSGEHAVVYGNPALALAVNRFLYTTISFNQYSAFELLFNQQRYLFTKTDLQQLPQIIEQRYQDYLQGSQPINRVIQQPQELLAYTIAKFFNYTKIPIQDANLSFEINSEIPIGCGMGSSAVIIVSLLTALSHWFDQPFSQTELYQLALGIENLQHGKSSGIDVRLAQCGGMLHFQRGESVSRPLPTFNFALINTGKPGSSTGECVNFVKNHFTNTDLINAFAEVTMALDQCLQTHHIRDMIPLIRRNHELLNHIGVVPKPVQEFIHAVEEQGGAAKICGAGSVRGDHAGIVLVLGLDNPSALCENYNFELMSNLSGVTHGAKLLL